MKKGLLFIVDVLVGFAILVIGFVLLLSYYYNVPISDQPSYYTDDILTFVTSTTFGDFNTVLTQQWLSKRFVDDDMLVGEKIAYFCNVGDSYNFTQLMNATVGGLVPEYVSYYVRVYDNNSLCLEFPANVSLASFNTSAITSTAHGVLLYAENTTLAAYDVEVAVW